MMHQDTGQHLAVSWLGRRQPTAHKMLLGIAVLPFPAPSSFFNLPLPFFFFLVAFGPDGSPLHYNLAASMDLAQPPAI